MAQLAAQLLDCQARLRSAQAEVDRRRRLDIERCGLEALEAGVNVLVEKPISNNILEARQMVAKAAEKNQISGM